MSTLSKQDALPSIKAASSLGRNRSLGLGSQALRPGGGLGDGPGLTAAPPGADGRSLGGAGAGCATPTSS
eukprot:3628494-Pyramimonas_sp.AAC.1